MELAVLAPGLIALIFLVIQAALFLHGRNVVDGAARYGARAARAYVPPQDDPIGKGQHDGETAAEDYVQQVGGKAVALDGGVIVHRDANTVHVEVHAKVVSLIPGFDIHITGTSNGPVERFVPGAGPGAVP
ncbi:MAG: TadE/TadG family type IV pilus assembly protein [Mycobacteriales bacterium]